MRLRVAAFAEFILNGQRYCPGDELEVPDEVADTWLSTGLVVPADGDWPEDLAPQA